MASPDPDSNAGSARAFPPLMPWLAGPLDAWVSRRGRWPHALLIDGPEGIGKRALAGHLARSCLCEAPDDRGHACGRCASCGYVAADAHPDLLRVEPVEIDEHGEAIPVDVISVAAIRRLTEWSQLSSHRRGAKVALIAPAERMNPSASNALLKTLEEPPPGTHLLLVAHQPGRLPATVRSRCQRIALPTPRAEPALDWLASQGVPAPAGLLAQAGGSPLRALALADPGYQAERAAWLAAIADPDRLAVPALAARIDLARKEERRGRWGQALDWLLAWTVDLAHASGGGEVRRNPEHAGAIRHLAARVARISLFRYHRALLRHRSLLGHPLNPRLAAEAALADYRALFA